MKQNSKNQAPGQLIPLRPASAAHEQLERLLCRLCQDRQLRRDFERAPYITALRLGVRLSAQMLEAMSHLEDDAVTDVVSL